MAGSHCTFFSGQGMEFDEVREYVPGDDIRMIDWNVTSRMGTPFTKVFREEKQLNLILIVDTSYSLMNAGEEKRELVGWIVAVLSLAAERTGDLIGGCLYSENVDKWLPPKRGRNHVLRLINDVLKSEPTTSGTGIRTALRTTSETLQRRGLCVIISDFKVDGFWSELAMLRRHHDVVAIRISEKNDVEFPETGAVTLKDPETGKIVHSLGFSKKFREAYKEHWEFHLLKLRNNFNLRKVDLIEIYVGDDPAVALESFFRRKRRKK